MEECESETVERLDQRRRKNSVLAAITVQRTTPAAAATSRPAPAQSTRERWANDEKYEDLRRNRLRPQQARCPCADTGVAPTDDRKGVVKSMTAQHKPGDEQKPTKGGYSQQGAKAAGLLITGEGGAAIFGTRSGDSCNARRMALSQIDTTSPSEPTA
jgi:hypothetical protein